jgi:hypothetical protein
MKLNMITIIKNVHYKSYEKLESVRISYKENYNY